MAQASLTARGTSRAGTKVEHNEPTLCFRCRGRHRIKATPGITGWYRLRVHIDGDVRHLDVGSTYPGAGEGPKGLAVRQLKGYASWVQTVQAGMLEFYCCLNLLNPYRGLNRKKEKTFQKQIKKSKLFKS
jgi:hypothetical protein